MKGVFIPGMSKPLKCSGEVDSNGKPKPPCPFYGTWECNITHGFVDEEGDCEKPCPLKEMNTFTTLADILSVFRCTETVYIDEVKKYGLFGWEKSGCDAVVLIQRSGIIQDLYKYLSTDILKREVVRVYERKNGRHIIILAKEVSD